MVHRKTDERQTVADKTNIPLFVFLLGILVATSTLVGILIIHGLLIPPVDSELKQDVPIEIVDEIVEQEPQESFLLIDFQPIVDNFIKNTSGSRSVLIYDLENEQVVGEYNTTETYNTASLYKLFVVYEGYLRIERGEWLSSDPAGRSDKSILECLDLAIRESNSTCAESLWQMIGHEALDSIIENDFDIHDSDISRLNSNPQDILKIMIKFYQHDELTNGELIARMKDSFLNQPTTTYNWRQGLPSGFSRANVYNKVGWDYNPDGKYWNIYHDAAIVEFSEQNRHYIVVVMTNRVPFEKIRDFGKRFEDYFYQNQ